ncbi:hypothetical protein LX77_00674 [Gelidibacter algens]|uniref:Uncharacterized protein n=1 Tax=Gelidibacter algens TaxID=49280 RepID=A0A1A7R3P5_9FLAO|nr:hypothetical protein [Gelidibacter algens]OBX26885.1 hypothetical protein A9996_02110 [Gelidibacter algens]RAJ26426.1 hypothetical protein LX77_00674 [Gelidibacter algens]
MDKLQLASLLEHITGHLKTSNDTQASDLQNAQKRIANSLLQNEDIGGEQLFANSNFYNKENITSDRLKSIETVAKESIEASEDDGFRTFIRTIPTRTSQISGSIPDWANGAKTSENLGPFINSEGRYVWVDVYKTIKLTTLYMGTDPVLLFNSKVDRISTRRLITEYSIVGGTVWVNAKLFSAEAAEGFFAGIKVTSGSIKLSKAASLVNKKITLLPNTTIEVSLKLEQANSATSSETSLYGKDARNCEFKLPETLQFNWNGTTKKITSLAIGDSFSKMYGQSLQFTYNPVPNPTIDYNSLLKVLAFPLQQDKTEFEVSESSSNFISLSGSAAIKKSYWYLPTAKIDVDHPLEAQGNGGIIVQCDKGLRAAWSNLANDDVRLVQPLIVGSPGYLGILDHAADGSGTSQHPDLWQDGQHPHKSSIDLKFLKNTPLLMSSSGAENEEYITTQCDTDFNIDRPIKVNGEPFEVRTKSSVLMLSASEDRRLVYLYDGNIIADNISKTREQDLPKPVAIALENALFTVSQVNTCLLFGEFDKDWLKVTKGNLFLSFGLYGYLPTLPDPYVGNLKSWERIFRSQGTFNNSRKNSLNMLICAVKHRPVDELTDKVSTSFYFGSFGASSVTDLDDTPAVSDADNNTTANSDPINSEDSPSIGDSHISRILSRRTSRVSPLLLRKQPADRIALTKKRIKELNNDDTKTLFATGKVMSAVRITKSYLEEISKTNNNLLESIGMQPNWDANVQSNEPTLATNYDAKVLAKEIAGYNLENAWDGIVFGGRLSAEPFALLDISSNANQLGVSVGSDMVIVKTGRVTQGTEENTAVVQNSWPFVVEGMQVKVKGQMARSFALPQIAWEPVTNLTPPDRSDPPASIKLAMDPEAGPLFYEDDGGATRIWNNNQDLVGLAPIPVVNSLVDNFQDNPQNYTVSTFTLPFGLKAISYISKNFIETVKPDINNLRPEFRKNTDGTNRYKGGIQLSLTSGNFGKSFSNHVENDSPMFPGYIIQLNNLVDQLGVKSGESNLGHRVTEIFNNEFLVGPLTKSNKLKDSRGVPVSRMDITGYGANIFSDWVSPTAAMAQTSQAKFDVMMGRTAHEVVQVKSILYPWGIRVVRTITVFRTGTGRIYRTDSGWKAESDGLFDFSYRYLKIGNDPMDPDLTDADFKTVTAPFEVHPGTIKGVFNVRNIKDAPSVKEYTASNTFVNGQTYVDGIKGVEFIQSGPRDPEPVKCGGVYFDADVEIENPTQGHTNNRVVSKKILGYVQVAPAGKPLTPKQLQELLDLQQGSIGGDLDCVIDVNKSNQQMRINRFDVNNANDKNGNPVFVVAARGMVVLPKAGSWSVVQHQAGTGEVSPIPSGTTVPLIRTGTWIKNQVIDPSVVSSQLLRIAHPIEILKNPSNQTINFGFLQTTATQKALFLTPSFGNGIKQLLSKTPPVFADAYRLMEGNGIFPNIGNAIDNFGKAMPMLNGIDSAGNTVKAFVTNALKDGETKVLELMAIEIEEAGEAIVDQGMTMLQKGANGVIDKALKFDIPQFEVPLVDTDALKIYIEYNTKNKPSSPNPNPVEGKLNFDVDSFADKLDEAAETWKSRVNNLAMVVDLGEMKRLLTIKGNFDAKKSKETGYEGADPSGTNGLPVPEIEFSDALQPVIDILEVLAQLSQGDYGETMKKGLKVAMSNSGEIWEYKFEATKEIPLVRFPPSDELYNSAQTPLKLEASLALGVYFNAALKVTTDPTQLLPTAGAFLQFKGGLSVMCVSVGVGSIYAVGSVGVKIAADTKVGPNLELAFAFGISIVVSLPVVGNASVTYMMGITMYADKDKVIITALMTFKGTANLLGGIVTVTIMIEAKGIIERIGNQTNASAQVTFALDISIFLVIDISFSKTWGEDRQVA